MYVYELLKSSKGKMNRSVVFKQGANERCKVLKKTKDVGWGSLF
jgi:hypothetical protein